MTKHPSMLTPFRIRKFAILSMLAMICLLLFHILFHAFYPNIPRALLIAVLVLPLTLPIRGMLKLQHKTYVWSSYLASFYILIAVDAFISYDRHFAISIFALTIIWFVSCFFFVRSRPKNKPSTK